MSLHSQRTSLSNRHELTGKVSYANDSMPIASKRPSVQVSNTLLQCGVSLSG